MKSIIRVSVNGLLVAQLLSCTAVASGGDKSISSLVQSLSQPGENDPVPLRRILYDGAWALGAATGLGICIKAAFEEQMYDMNRRTFMHGVLPENAASILSTGGSRASQANLASHRVPIMPLGKCAWIAIVLATINMAKLTLSYSELTYEEGLRNPTTARAFSKVGGVLKKLHDRWLE